MSEPSTSLSNFISATCRAKRCQRNKGKTLSGVTIPRAIRAGRFVGHCLARALASGCSATSARWRAAPTRNPARALQSYEALSSFIPAVFLRSGTPACLPRRMAPALQSASLHNCALAGFMFLSSEGPSRNCHQRLARTGCLRLAGIEPGSDLKAIFLSRAGIALGPRFYGKTLQVNPITVGQVVFA